MSVGTKAFIGAFISGMGSGITGYLMSKHPDDDIVPLVAAAIAGGCITAGAYLQGVRTPTPPSMTNGKE